MISWIQAFAFVKWVHLHRYTSENLGPTCGAENVDLCNDEQKKTIAEKQALSAADLTKEIDAAEVGGGVHKL